MKRKKQEYAFYKGDEYIDQGTIEELAKKYNKSTGTFWYWASNEWKLRRTREDTYIVVKIEEDE